MAEQNEALDTARAEATDLSIEFDDNTNIEDLTTKISEAKKVKADAEFEESIKDLSEEEQETKRKEYEKGSHTTTEREKELEELLKIETEKTVAQEKAMAKQRFDDAEAKRKRLEEGGDGEDEDKKTVTFGQMKSMLADHSRDSTKSVNEDRAKELAQSMTDSAVEGNLIFQKWKNRNFELGMTLTEQIEETFAIVNAKSILGKNAELRRAVLNRHGVSTHDSGDHQTKKKEKMPTIDPIEKEALIKDGYKWTGSRWEKKTKEGDLLYIGDEGDVVREPKESIVY